MDASAAVITPWFCPTCLRVTRMEGSRAFTRKCADCGNETTHKAQRVARENHERVLKGEEPKPPGRTFHTPEKTFPHTPKPKRRYASRGMR